MASPTTDGVATNGTWTGTSSATVSLTTSNTNDLIVVVVSISDASTPPSVSSVTASGLTFTRRNQVQETSSGTTKVTGEVWTAPSSGALSALVITVTAAATVNSGCIVAFGVNGLNSLATPWDTNASLPSTGQTTTGTTSAAVTYSTTFADDLLFAYYAGDKSGAGSGTPSGWTSVGAIAGHFGSSRFNGLGVFVKSVSAVQTSQTFTPANSTAGGLNSVTDADAFTADAASTAYSLSIATGSYSVAGQTSSFYIGRTLLIPTGLYLVTGSSTGNTQSIVLSVETGNYFLEGLDVGLTSSSKFHGTFSEFNNESFLDWGTNDFNSFLAISQSDDAIDVKEQTPYIYTFLKETTDSDENSEGATLTGYWDWANDTTSLRVSQPIEIYKFHNGFLVCARKHKMRGRGRQLQLRFDSETGKNFNLLGWAVFYTHNAQQ